MKIRTIKTNGLKRTILAMTCLLLTAGLTTGVSDADSIDATTAPQTQIDVEILLALVAEVKNLRLELLEHRLETYDQRIALLELGLEKVATERSGIDDKDAQMNAQADEIEFLLQDPDLDGGERSYLEASREELDSKRSRTLDNEIAALDNEEDDLESRYQELQKTRTQIAAHIRGLIGNSNP